MKTSFWENYIIAAGAENPFPLFRTSRSSPALRRALAAARIAEVVASLHGSGRVHEPLGRIVKELDKLRSVLWLPQLRHRAFFDLPNPLLAHPQHLANVA